MRLGYSLGPLLSAEEVLACARLADGKENVDSIWVPESWGRESFATLGAVSQVTKRVRLGTSIVSIFSRTPATVAMGAVTLDMLSGNRAVIGLGSSTEAIVENWHGVRFERPVSHMREFVECLNLMISGERVNYAGEFFRASNFKLLNAPPRKHVPVFMAAVNKKMVSLACQLADGVILYLRPLDELKKTVAEIRRATSGKKFEIALSLICAVSDSEPDRARRRAAKTLAFYVAVGKYYSRFLAENGFSAEVDKIKHEYAKGGDAAADAVTDSMLDSLAVCGTSSDCRSALSRFADAGVTLPIMQVNPVENAESSFREMLSTF
jgi:alkanesulfonate monooxygenase SsuD/methylene tetrahydromethanopterin reductase-like flavin-dependent oxidoreductase (luciferase family)